MSQAHRPAEPSRSASDTWLRQTLFEPLAATLPKSLKPNSITACTPVFASLSFACAAWAPHLEPWQAAVARVLAGFFMFASMLSDYVDGIHARRTGQSSKLGEALDHWFDAYNVPLATFGLALTLQMPAPLALVLIVATAMVYHAQLVVYHHTSKFMYPPFGGASAQVSLSLAYIGFAALFLAIPRDIIWVDLLVYAIVGATLVSLLQQTRFYVNYFDKAQWAGFLGFVLTGSQLGALGGIGGIRPELAMALLVVSSLRITGRYVLRTVAPQPYGGYDALLIGGGAMLWLIALLAPLQTVAGYFLADIVAMVLLATALLVCSFDFLRTATKLKAHPPTAPAALPFSKEIPARGLQR